MWYNRYIMDSSSVYPTVIYSNESHTRNIPDKKCNRRKLSMWCFLILGFMAYIIIFGKALSYIKYDNDGSDYI